VQQRAWEVHGTQAALAMRGDGGDLYACGVVVGLATWGESAEKHTATRYSRGPSRPELDVWRRVLVVARDVVRGVRERAITAFYTNLDVVS
jgi:hypothetical protein